MTILICVQVTKLEERNDLVTKQMAMSIIVIMISRVMNVNKAITQLTLAVNHLWNAASQVIDAKPSQNE